MMKPQMLLVFFALCLIFPPQVMAQDDGLEAAQKKFSGSYVSAQNAKKERAAISARIDKLVAKMAFIKRPFARSALEDSTAPCAHITVTFSGDKMAIHCKGRRDVTSPKDGTVIDWKGDDGKTLRLSQKLEPGRMVQVFQRKDGALKKVYTLGDGGKTLRVAVTVSSGQLPHPLTYTRELRRK